MNVLKELAEYFPSFCTSLQDAPSYVSCHWNESKSIILVYKKGQYTSCVTPRKREHTTIISEFELTGSPLKLDMAYDKLEETFLMDVSQCWLKEEIFHNALTMDEASHVVGFYNRKISSLPAEERIPLWVVCDGSDQKNTLLMAALSFKGYFNRANVSFLETTTVSDLSIDKMKKMHLSVFGCSKNQVPSCTVSGSYRISGKRLGIIMQNNTDDVYTKHYNGMTKLECEWSKPTLTVPIYEATINLVQEVIIGHEMSGATVLWKSVCALQGISSALIGLASTFMPVKLKDITIRPFNTLWIRPNEKEQLQRLEDLVSEVEEYEAMTWEPPAGCVCISDDTTTLQQVFKQYAQNGSSNDFTYKLWDILKDCGTAEELVTLLVLALKGIVLKNLHPFIDPHNTTFLGALVKKLARGCSQQAVNSLTTLYTNPSRALNIVGQLGLFKMCWEYTSIFSLIDSTLAFNDRLKLQNKLSEVYEEAYNQTMTDMSLGSGDMSINPFEGTKCNLMDSTFMQDCEPAVSDNLVDLTLDDFASLKKHNIHVKTEKKIPANEQPLFSDDTNVEFSSKEWKFKLTRLAQLHTSLEHVYRAQQSLNFDLITLKPIAVQVLDYYTADTSPIKTVGQLRNEPVQTFSVPVQFKDVKEHLQFKHATTYKVTLTSRVFLEKKNVNNTNSWQPYNKNTNTNSINQAAVYNQMNSLNNQEKNDYVQTISSIYVCSQQPVFPPTIHTPKDVPEDNESLIYHVTRNIYLSNKF